eukprot:TRINITY_DN6928_c0_g5_i1.p1 TRINITY_DN6928_c0_g5~~TRINITY_DN6928_c0_g5_i1.p1  ORF type:complete len:268 (+),score=45.94 TRINITY_DN6928_c0_g5_i1:103-804(+)
MVLAEGIKGHETETVNSWDRQDCDSDETESFSPRLLFSHKLSDASTAAGPEVVTAAPARKVADGQGTSKGKRKSRAAHAKGKQGPICGLRSELRAQGQQIMKDLSMPARMSKRQLPMPAKMVPVHRSVAQPAGKVSPPPGLPPPPGLELDPSLGYDAGSFACGRFGPYAPGTVSTANEQALSHLLLGDHEHVPNPWTSADASHFDEDHFTKAHWRLLRNEAQEEMFILGRLSL